MSLGSSWDPSLRIYKRFYRCTICSCKLKIVQKMFFMNKKYIDNKKFRWCLFTSKLPRIMSFKNIKVIWIIMVILTMSSTNLWTSKAYDRYKNILLTHCVSEIILRLRISWYFNFGSFDVSCTSSVNLNDKKIH